MMRGIMLMLAMLLALPAAAVDEVPIGYVKTVAGEGSVTSAGNKVIAEVGTPIFEGSTLRTGARSSMGVTFKDETVMSFGPDTELTVVDYLYAPARGKLKLGSKMTKGSANFVSGVIAKLQPEAVTVDTPTGTIGVRGTQFLLKVEE